MATTAPASPPAAKDDERIRHTPLWRRMLVRPSVGALIAAGPQGFHLSKIFGLVAIALASVNIFGGFLVTNRMLAMYKKKDRG